MKAKLRWVARRAYAALAVALASAGLVPMLYSHAFAYGQVTTRSVKISSSAAGATGQTYTVKFDTATSGTIHGIVVNFCDDNPLIGNSCGWTSGQSIDVTSATFTSITGTPDTTVGGSNWQISANANSATAGNGVILALTDANAAENGSITAPQTITIVLGGITNPNYSTCGSPDIHPNCSFYARILTYSTTAGATGYASQTIGAPTDAGGDALSTNSNIAITANVMEQLTFCISASSTLVTGANTCSTGGAVTNPAITIGHGSPTAAIDSTTVDQNFAYTQLSTNASGGAKVLMKSSNSCVNGGLSSSGGAVCNIPGVGSSAAALTAGTAAFGMCVNNGANTTVVGNYHDTVNSCPTGSTTYTAGTLMGMNGGAVNSTNTYGDQIFSTAGAVFKENNTLAFAATASLTTPAGIYTTNENLVATGTF